LVTYGCRVGEDDAHATYVDVAIKIMMMRNPNRVASGLYLYAQVTCGYNTVYIAYTIQTLYTATVCHLTLPLSHNLSKLRLRLKNTSCVVDSDLVKPSAT
jgi:hypothetical protein